MPMASEHSSFGSLNTQSLPQASLWNRSSVVPTQSNFSERKASQGASSFQKKKGNPIKKLFGTFRGTATTLLGAINPLTGEVTNVISRNTTSVASISKRKKAGGVTERNPFNFSISSSPNEVSGLVEGSFSTFSALPFDFRGGFLVQYWSFKYNGQRIKGELERTNSDLSLATNTINANENFAGIVTPSLYTMNAGTTIRRRITRQTVQVRIQGVATGLVSSSYAFVIDVSAKR
jgi:hypothetical protein